MTTRGRARTVMAGGAAVMVLVGGACTDDSDLDLPADEEIETPGPGLDEGEDLPAVEGDQGESENFDDDVDVDSGIQGVDEG